MLKDIVEAKALDGYQLFLRFENGVQGVVDVAELIELHGVFAALADQDFFGWVGVNLESGTGYWPNDADLDLDVLYTLVTNEPIPYFEMSLPL